MRIILIRHGQTTSDVENRYGGDYDDQLSEEGSKQTVELVEKLKDTQVDIIYSSPKIRALQVADKLTYMLGCKLETIDDLRERNKNGILTGLTKEEAKERYPSLVEAVKDYRNQIEGAESFADFEKRVRDVWDKIIKLPFDSVAVITHGGVIITLFKDIFNIGLVEVSDCGYAVINYENGNVSVEKMGGIEIMKD